MIVVVATPEELKIAPQTVDEADKVVITGVGALNVLRALRDEPRDEEIVNIGYVGSNILPVGTKCSPREVRLYHPNVNYAENEMELDTYAAMENPICYTSTDFVTENKVKEAAIFDMELAFIVAMGFKTVRAIKVVSDNLSVKEYEETINDRES